MMYVGRYGLTLGFHGTTRPVAEKVFAGEEDLRRSENPWDWLGHGVYFWENSPSRADDFAAEYVHRKRLDTETGVVGAVLNPGQCLDLTEHTHLQLLRGAWSLIVVSGQPLPENRTVGTSRDLLLRDRDCAVIQMLHTMMDKAGMPGFDSVRGVFWEGEELYPGAGFREKDHVQICIRNPNCIKGFFRPRQHSPAFSRV